MKDISRSGYILTRLWYDSLVYFLYEEGKPPPKECKDIYWAIVKYRGNSKGTSTYYTVENVWEYKPTTQEVDMALIYLSDTLPYYNGRQAFFNNIPSSM